METVESFVKKYNLSEKNLQELIDISSAIDGKYSGSTPWEQIKTAVETIRKMLAGNINQSERGREIYNYINRLLVEKAREERSKDSQIRNEKKKDSFSNNRPCDCENINQESTLVNPNQTIMVGVGWGIDDYCGTFDFDLDLVAFICNSAGKVSGDNDLVFYNNPDWMDHTVWATGDNMAGAAETGDDDEQIFIDLSRMPAWVKKIVIAVTIYNSHERKQSFNQVKQIRLRIAEVEAIDDFAHDVIGHTVLETTCENSTSKESAMIVCEIERNDSKWICHMPFEGKENGLEGLCSLYGIEV